MFWTREDPLTEMTDGSDIEALQTDIQRFVAILGFCLMAIFALVQSIPVTAKKQETVIEDLSQKVASQNAELQRLKAENDELKARMDALGQYADAVEALELDLSAARDSVRRQDDKIVGLLEEKLDVKSNLMKYKALLIRREAEIETLVQEKRRVERRLNETVAALTDSAKLKRKIERLERRLEKADRTADELAKMRRQKARLLELLKKANEARRVAEAPKPKPVKKPAEPKPKPVKKPVEPKPKPVKKPTEPKPKPEEKTAGTKGKKGSYVTFDLEEKEFLDLLGSGKVSLFIQVEGMEKWFRVVSIAGRVDFESQPADSDLDLWEMGEELVPSRILDDFRSYTTLATRKKMIIIGLPPGISAQVRKNLKKGGESGKIIIKNNGSVAFEPFGG